MTKANRNGIARALRIAAKSVANGVLPDGDEWDVKRDGACLAIRWSHHELWDDALTAFGGAMLCWGRCEDFWWPRDEAHRNVRVIALLLTADAVEAGDLP